MTSTQALDRKYGEDDIIISLSSSLQSFMRSRPIHEWIAVAMKEGAICEVGCGALSLFSKWDELFSGRLHREMDAFDLSQVAVERAKGAYKDPHINYKVQDIRQSFGRDKYTCIIDGHCLHSLASLPDAFAAMKHIYDALTPDGLFLGEVMMAHKNMSFEEGLYYSDHDYVLYKGETPSRLIMSARQWEDFFLNCGFSIKYFMCQSSIKFIPHDKRESPLPNDPECLRFVLEKLNVK